ncbi:MAG: hypothetical protein PHS14_02985, partial [Elusimicrobia bacterium]|nr:hypothetical protein [Elusimicrobiota bacterium]
SFNAAATNFVDSKAMLAMGAAVCGKPIGELNASFKTAASNFGDSKALLAVGAACVGVKDRRVYSLILMANRLAVK